MNVKMHIITGEHEEVRGGHEESSSITFCLTSLRENLSLSQKF